VTTCAPRARAEAGDPVEFPVQGPDFGRDGESHPELTDGVTDVSGEKPAAARPAPPLALCPTIADTDADADADADADGSGGVSPFCRLCGEGFGTGRGAES